MAQFSVVGFTGTRRFGPIDVPTNIAAARIALDGAGMMDPTLRGSLQLDLSLDGGITWSSDGQGPDTDPFPVTMEFVGGVKNKQGQPLPEYNLSVNFPHPELTTRALRARLVVDPAGAALTTTATLTAA